MRLYEKYWDPTQELRAKILGPGAVCLEMCRPVFALLLYQLIGKWARGGWEKISFCSKIKFTDK